MNEELITKLPPEIIINILSRLQVLTVIACKCVCKSWLDLIETPDFAKSHLSKSVPGLVTYRDMGSDPFNIFEFEDAVELGKHELHYNPVMQLERRAFITLPYACISIQGSANGLLFLREINTRPNALWICNPITREYIELPHPERAVYYYPTVVTYGFGVSQTSGEYKVVRIYHERVRDPVTYSLMSIPKYECQVYTLGKGFWRSINVTPGTRFEYSCRSTGVFLNRNLHWMVADLTGSYLISCLNLETEVFSSFSSPIPPENRRLLCRIVNLEGCLCLCDNSCDDEIVMWVMKEYGVNESWETKYVISKIPSFGGESFEVVSPLKVFRDGDILMWWETFYLFYYYNKTKAATTLDLFRSEKCGFLHATLHTSSFVSLKSFRVENMKTF